MTWPQPRRGKVKAFGMGEPRRTLHNEAQGLGTERDARPGSLKAHSQSWKGHAFFKMGGQSVPKNYSMPIEFGGRTFSAHIGGMFGVKLSEIAIISVFVALAFGILFVPKSYGPYLQYLGIAAAAFMLARWLFRRWRSSQ